MPGVRKRVEPVHVGEKKKYTFHKYYIIPRSPSSPISRKLLPCAVDDVLDHVFHKI